MTDCEKVILQVFVRFHFPQEIEMNYDRMDLSWILVDFWSEAADADALERGASDTVLRRSPLGVGVSDRMPKISRQIYFKHMA